MSVESAAAWIAVGGTLSGATVAYLGTITIELSRSRRERKAQLERSVSELIAACRSCVDAIEHLRKLRGGAWKDLARYVQIAATSIERYMTLTDTMVRRFKSLSELDEPRWKRLLGRYRKLRKARSRKGKARSVWRRVRESADSDDLYEYFLLVTAAVTGYEKLIDRLFEDDRERERYEQVEPYLRAMHEAQARVIVSGAGDAVAAARKLVTQVNSMTSFLAEYKSAKEWKSARSTMTQLENKLTSAIAK